MNGVYSPSLASWSFRESPYKNINLLKSLILLLLLINFGIPNLSVAADWASPITYRVPKECSPYVKEIEKYGWDTSIVIQIMYKESRCNPLAVNKLDNHKTCIGSYNILQVGCLHYKAGEDKKDPILAIAKSYELYEKRGNFQDWTTCRLIKGCV